MGLAYSRTYPLDRRFAVEFHWSSDRIEARWTPHLPKGRKARYLLPAYRRARNDFLASLDINIVVIEL